MKKSLLSKTSKKRQYLISSVVVCSVAAGFRVQPRSELFFKKIVKDLVAKQELNLHIRPDGSTKCNAEPDFKGCCH